MGSVKDLIHSCEHGLDIDGCLDCHYNMSISHLPVIYRPSIETWYNRKPKKTIKRKVKKVANNDCPF